MMQLVHSCCPRKHDIHAPEFEQQWQTKLGSGKTITEYRCKACKTVVVTYEGDEL